MSNLEKLINQGNWGGFFDAIDVNRDGTLSHQVWAPRDLLAVLDFPGFRPMIPALYSRFWNPEVSHQTLRPWRGRP